MTGRQERLRARHRVPLTWEVPTLVVIGAALLLCLAALVVQGLACLLTTGAFGWPTGREVDAVAAILRGRFGVGLDPGQQAALPPPRLLSATCLAADTTLATCLAFGAVALRRGHVTGHGLAGRSEAARALGARALRRRVAVVRPDLHRSTRLRKATAGRDIGWRLGTAGRPGPALLIPYDRTTCVVGPQGSGKTLAVLAPALVSAPGGALVTLTKPEDLFLTVSARRTQGRPVAVLDPFGLARGLPELVWDPIAGCEDPVVAERRAKAFAAGTVRNSSVNGGDQAARFYAGECAKVLQGYFHAAALTGLDLDHVLDWVADPRQSHQASETLRRHPDAEPHWHGLLHAALHGDDRTAGNTITTLQQAMSLFFQGTTRSRCVPSPGRPATDLSDLIARRGTVYLLAREDPYVSASPLMTAVAEDVLDIAKRLGETSPHGRLCPPFLACLDELPSTAPVPTLPTRMANERGLGVSFILAIQTWRQLVVSYGEDVARTIMGLSNNLVVFGGGKDIGFYRELSELLGTTTQMQLQHSSRDLAHPGSTGSWIPRQVPVLEAGEIRRLSSGQALLIADSAAPVIARVRRCTSGRSGREVRQQQQTVRATVRRSSDD